MTVLLLLLLLLELLLLVQFESGRCMDASALLHVAIDALNAERSSSSEPWSCGAPVTVVKNTRCSN